MDTIVVIWEPMMPTNIESVRGPMQIGDLGHVLMHEHVFIVNADILQNYPDHWDKKKRIADAIAKLTAAKAAGIDTIVDPTVVGLGRYIPWIQEVNAAVDINIIAATGLYTFHDLPHFFEFRGPGTIFDGPDPMIELFVRDIKEGIADTGVKAAFLKCVIEEAGLVPGVERIATAVAETHKETGAPITVHTNSEHETGRLAIEHFKKLGVDLTKVVIGHAGDSTNVDYLKFIGDSGAIIGCDRFGLDLYCTTAERVSTIAALCKDGYADRIVLAHDVSCYLDYFPGDEAQAAAAQFMPNWHLLHIPNDVLPALREAGVSDDQIQQMMVTNPQRYFA
ncbi:MAG: phosphotriesterase-related protein [Antricoccus sp.]